MGFDFDRCEVTPGVLDASHIPAPAQRQLRLAVSEDLRLTRERLARYRVMAADCTLDPGAAGWAVQLMELIESHADALEEMQGLLQASPVMQQA
jgi:hypothetical protein